MGVTAGDILGIQQPAAGESCRLPVFLLNAAGTYVTGEAWDAAGMDVKYLKEGDSAYTAFPSFATGNWDEIGYGLYVVILDGDESDEAALLDTTGLLSVRVVTSLTRGDIFGYKLSPADVLRSSVVSKNAVADAILQRFISSVEDTAAVGAVARALAMTGHKTAIVGDNLVVYKYDDTEWFSAPITTNPNLAPITMVDPTI